MTPCEGLTPREIQLSILVSEGLTNREIGRIVVLAEEWANMTESSGKLGIERRHVENGPAVLDRVANPEAFSEEPETMRHIDQVGVDDRLAPDEGGHG